MASITIRNIPESIFSKIRLFSEIDRRSMNNEFLIIIESGLKEMERRLAGAQMHLSTETQQALWADILGKWKDKKSTKKQIDEIYKSRTLGRDVSL